MMSPPTIYPPPYQPRPRPPLADLPNEILSAIFARLPPPALAALVLVSRRFQAVAERHLYTAMHITDQLDPPPHDAHVYRAGPVTPPHTAGACIAVLRRPHLAHSLRKLCVRWVRDRATPTALTLAPPVLPRLAHLLRAATQLDSLELHLAGYMDGWDALLAGCAFRLRCLALSGPPNAPLAWLLAAQPYIQHLHLPDHNAPLVLPAGALPLLETFRGDARAAASLVPGRPVRGLALCGREPDEECLIKLSCARGSVRRLDLGALSVTPRQLLTISKHLTDLESLRMRLALRHTLHFTFSGMMLLSALTQVLGAFGRLAHLDLSPTSVDGVRGLHNVAEEASLCHHWALVCPSLRRVWFPSGAEWVREGLGAWGRVGG